MCFHECIYVCLYNEYVLGFCVRVKPCIIMCACSFEVYINVCIQICMSIFVCVCVCVNTDQCVCFRMLECIYVSICFYI